MRTESTPLANSREMFEPWSGRRTPYLATVGWPSDIPAISKAQADEFTPFTMPAERRSASGWGLPIRRRNRFGSKIFHRIPRGKSEPPDVVTLEVEQLAESGCTPRPKPIRRLTSRGIQFRSAPGHLRASISFANPFRPTVPLYKGLVLGRQVGY